MPLIGYNKKYEPIVAKERTTEMTNFLTILAQAATETDPEAFPSILIMLIPLAVMVLIVIAFGLTRFLITRHRINKHSTNLEEMLNSNTDNRKEK